MGMLRSGTEPLIIAQSEVGHEGTLGSALESWARPRPGAAGNSGAANRRLLPLPCTAQSPARRTCSSQTRRWLSTSAVTTGYL